MLSSKRCSPLPRHGIDSFEFVTGWTPNIAVLQGTWYDNVRGNFALDFGQPQLASDRGSATQEEAPKQHARAAV